MNKACVSILLMLLTVNSYSEDKYGDVEEVVVTADRIEQSSKELTDAHTIISRKEIEQSGHQTVEEILANQPGVDIRRSGGRGRTTSIFMRGTNSDSGTVILIDGVNVTSPITNTYTDIQNFSLENVERIEIIRGPQASLYGQSAVGGVINIITRKGKSKQTESHVFGHTKLGSHNMIDIGLGMSVNDPRFNFYFMGGYADTDGYIQPRDGHRMKDFLFSGTFRPDELSEVNVFGKYNESMVQLYQDGGVAHTDDLRQNDTNSIFSVAYKKLFYGIYEPIVRFNYKSFLTHSESTFSSPQAYHTRSFSGSIQNNFYMFNGKNILTIGYEYGQDEYLTVYNGFSATTDQGIARDHHSVFASNLFRAIKRLYVNTSVRVDFWGSSYNWTDTLLNIKGGLAYHILDNKSGNISFIKVRANVSSVNSVPAYNDVSGMTDPTTLNPEKYFNIDAGFDIHFLKNKHKLMVSYFHTYAKDFIFYDFTNFVVQNGGTAFYDGFEIEMKNTLPLGFTTKFAYTYTTIDLNASDNRQLATRRPNHKALAYINWNYIKALNVNFNWLYTGSRKDLDTLTTGTPVVTLGSYQLVNFSASYTFFKYFTVLGKINNLLNENYEDPDGFTQDGRNFYGGFKFKYPLG